MRSRAESMRISRSRLGVAVTTLAVIAVMCLAASPGANALTAFGSLSYPNGIAMNPEGDVFVSSYYRIDKFNADGQLLLSFGSQGAGNPQFVAPQGVAVGPTGKIFVADPNSGSGLIKRFSSTGDFEISWPSPAFDVGVDQAGNVYAAEANSYRVVKFDQDGNPISSWGSSGSGPGKFPSPPANIAVDASGNNFVAEYSPGRISEFDASGTFVTSWSGGQLNNPQGIGVDPAGANVYVTNTGDGRILRFSPAGILLGSFGSTGAALGQFTMPQGVAASNGGRVYVADSSNGRIQVFDTSEPQALITASMNPANAGQAVALSAANSFVPLQSISGYDWDLDGDGRFETDSGVNPVVSKMYPSRQVVHPSVRVTAPGGKSATATMTLTVGPVGVSINNGSQFTNDPVVSVDAIWPPAAENMMVANDGGFADLK